MWLVTDSTVGPTTYSDRVNITPDTKDWTWVLESTCADCGFDTSQPSRADLAPLSRELSARWRTSMAQISDPRSRPEPVVWSPLEYSCHVRDVFALGVVRVHRMLDEDDPMFANWDQDETAVAEDYSSQDPAAVTADLMDSASDFAATLDSVPEGAWERRGRRSDGAVFTVESFARYLLHDPIHHLTDVSRKRWDESS
jgi:hypothetical protein